MKNKTVLAVLLLGTMLLFCSCENQTNQGENATVIPEPTEEAADPEVSADVNVTKPVVAEEPIEETKENAETETEAEPEVTADGEPEEKRFELMIPAEYAEPSYKIGEVEWNADGSVTYSLTEEEHEQLLLEVHAYIQKELDAMCASRYFPHFDSITANEDCSVFTVVVIDIETSKAEQKSIHQFYKFGRMYAAYEGAEPGNIHIDYMTKIGNIFVTRDSEKDESMLRQ